jgi:uncharacterized membrane protein
VTNMEISELIGFGGRRGISIFKTIEIDAPVEEIFHFWTHFENFPTFMSHLREVEMLDNRRSRWVAAGPVGVPVQWEAVTTSIVPHRLIAWESVEHSIVGHTGSVQFMPIGKHRTRLHVQMSYTPPAGVLGHLVALLFGADPKRAMDDDLRRLKSLFEFGRTHAHGHAVTRSDAGVPEAGHGFMRGRGSDEVPPPHMHP